MQVQRLFSWRDSCAGNCALSGVLRVETSSGHCGQDRDDAMAHDGQCRWMAHAVLCSLAVLLHHIARAAFATAALGGDAEHELEVVEVQTGRGVAGDFPITDALADANNHVDSPGNTVDVVSINANYFYLYLTMTRLGEMPTCKRIWPAIIVAGQMLRRKR
jgi:hypothetical protein